MATTVITDEDDIARCRLCGCTDEEACEGGCSWVEDPAGEGDVCSECLPAALKGAE